MEFGLGIRSTEDKTTKRKCSDLYPREYSENIIYDWKNNLINGGYFNKCFDIDYDLNYSLMKDHLQKTSPNRNYTQEGLKHT